MNLYNQHAGGMTAQFEVPFDRRTLKRMARQEAQALRLQKAFETGPKDEKPKKSPGEKLADWMTAYNPSIWMAAEIVRIKTEEREKKRARWLQQFAAAEHMVDIQKRVCRR